jgi:ketosteroid isomerase-like protein
MSSKIDLESLRRDIEVVNSKWSSAVNSGNPSAIEECLDEGAMFLGPGAPAIIGRDAVVAEAKTWMDAGATNESFEIIEVFGDGDVAYQVGTYSIDYPQEDGSLETDKGKFVDIFWRQKDGSWKAHVSILNSDSE